MLSRIVVVALLTAGVAGCVDDSKSGESTDLGRVVDGNEALTW